MPSVLADDDVKLHYEEVGRGVPILFLHEYGGDHRGWEPQMRFFGRHYRCIAYAARGFPPSDIPSDPAQYSATRAVADAAAVLDHLEIERAHVVGLAMGSFTTLYFGLAHPARTASLVVAGCGYGSDGSRIEEHHRASDAIARLYEEHGAAAAAEKLASGPARIQYMLKDPRGWLEFAARMAERSALGAALTQRGVLRDRPSVYGLESELRRLAVPTLLIVGDEDDPCLEPNLFLKRTIPASGLVTFPRSGHTLNLEESDLFNRTVQDFLTAVETDTWRPRDPRSFFPPRPASA